jgi:hypothetical protein
MFKVGFSKIAIARLPKSVTDISGFIAKKLPTAGRAPKLLTPAESREFRRVHRHLNKADRLKAAKERVKKLIKDYEAA